MLHGNSGVLERVDDARHVHVFCARDGHDIARMDRARGVLPVMVQRQANPATIRGSVEAVLTAD